MGNKDGRGSVVELSQDAALRVPEEARKILPSHAQQATTYFSGGDFFIIARRSALTLASPSTSMSP